MGGGGADHHVAVLAADVAQTGQALDVDQALHTQQAFLEDQQHFGAARVERGVAALARE